MRESTNIPIPLFLLWIQQTYSLVMCSGYTSIYPYTLVWTPITFPVITSQIGLSTQSTQVSLENLEDSIKRRGSGTVTVERSNITKRFFWPVN